MLEIPVLLHHVESSPQMFIVVASAEGVGNLGHDIIPSGVASVDENSHRIAAVVSNNLVVKFVDVGNVGRWVGLVAKVG